MTEITNLASLLGTSNRLAETNETSSTPTYNDTSLLNPEFVVDAATNAIMQAVDTSDVRLDKVARLKAAIENGTYSVSTAALADKLISSMLGRD